MSWKEHDIFNDLDKVDTSGALGRGVYALIEVARLTGLPPGRVREWFGGRTDRRGRGPVLNGDYAPVNGQVAVSFLDLVDVLVAGQLRELGVSLQTVRRVYAILRTTLQTRHPFSHRGLFSDGKRVFHLSADEAGDQFLVDLLARQQVFVDVLLPYLKQIDYSPETKLAERWRIAPGVVVDPQRCFGKPIVADWGVTTHVIAAAVEANERSIDKVATIFNMDPRLVQNAVEFEARIAA